MHKSEALAMKCIESKTTNDIIESRQSQGLDSGSVCSRSGVSGDSLSTSDTKFAQQTCNNNDRFYHFRKFLKRLSIGTFIVAKSTFKGVACLSL